MVRNNFFSSSFLNVSRCVRLGTFANVVSPSGTITSLKNVKKDVQEMRKGTECGMGFEEWEAFEVGDQIQTYEEFSEKRRL